MSARNSSGWAAYKEPLEPSCGLVESGSCSFLEPCSSGQPQLPVPTANAGTVTVNGTPLVIDESGQIYLGMLESAISPGDLVDMSATGSDEVPAHSGSVVVPELTTVLEPSLGDVVSIDRSEDLEVTWNPVADGSVGVGVTVLLTPYGSANVTCSAPASLGRLTVPAHMLARLPPTDPAVDMTGSISVSQGEQTKLTPDGWEIWLFTGEGNASAVAEIF